MFDTLVTYHVHKRNPLPANDALAYQYILAGNGVFIRAETRFFEALSPIAPCAVRGLDPLPDRFQLKVPRIPAHLLNSILTDAQRARRPDGGLNEALYQFHHHKSSVAVKKPPQRATANSVTATTNTEPNIILDLHSHGNMAAFWSQHADDIDERGARFYAVIGRLDARPEIKLRLGVYGYWLPLPITALFDGSGPFVDAYERTHKRGKYDHLRISKPRI